MPERRRPAFPRTACLSVPGIVTSFGAMNAPYAQPVQQKSRAGMWIGLGCGCLTLLLIAVGIGGYFAFKAGKGLVEKGKEYMGQIAGFVGPADGSWDEADWPANLEGGWSATQASPESAPAFVPGHWTGRRYANSAGETVAVFVGKSSESERSEVSSSLSTYTLDGNGTRSSSGATFGPRQTRKTSLNGTTQAFELWSANNGWCILVIGSSEAQTTEVATGFLAAVIQNTVGGLTPPLPTLGTEAPASPEAADPAAGKSATGKSGAVTPAQS